MDPIYLDHAATTPLRPEAREAMAPYLDREWGNPSSVHRWGRSARNAVEEARERVAEALGVSATEVFFVRGGTEADNLAFLGRTRSARAGGNGVRAALTTVEHSALREAAAQAEREGAQVYRLSVSPGGEVDLEALDRFLGEGGAVVSVMWVNNETGLRLPVEQVAQRCRAHGVPFHTDAVQALGRVPVELASVPWDLVTFSAHKVGGPKGAAVLLARDVESLAPLHYGGGQEHGLRPGTEDVAGAVGLARAVGLAVEEREAEEARLTRLRESLEAGLRARIRNLRVHGEEGIRAPHLLNVGVPGLDAAALVMSLDLAGVAASQGSACRSGSSTGSPVLEALYGEEVEGVATLRLSLGWTTGPEQVEEAVRRIASTVEKLLEMEAAS